MSNPTHIIEFDITLIVCCSIKYQENFGKEDIKQETFWNKQQSILQLKTKQKNKVNKH